MRNLILLASFSMASFSAYGDIPMEAMRVLGSFRGNYTPVNCSEKIIKNDVEQKAYACQADLVQISYQHTNGVLQNYFFSNGQTSTPTFVYGRMVSVGQMGCRDMDSLDSKECFDISPGYFAQNVDYKFPMVCGDKEVINSTKIHWELKKVGTGVEMIVHEDIFYNICADNKLVAPMEMTKDLTVQMIKQ